MTQMGKRNRDRTENGERITSKPGVSQPYRENSEFILAIAFSKNGKARRISGPANVRMAFRARLDMGIELVS